MPAEDPHVAVFDPLANESRYASHGLSWGVEVVKGDCGIVSSRWGGFSVDLSALGSTVRQSSSLSSAPSVIVGANGTHAQAHWDRDHSAQMYLGSEVDREVRGWFSWIRRCWTRSSGWSEDKPDSPASILEGYPIDVNERNCASVSGCGMDRSGAWPHDRMEVSPVVQMYRPGDANLLVRGCWDWSRRRLVNSLFVMALASVSLGAHPVVRQGGGYAVQEHLAFDVGGSVCGCLLRDRRRWALLADDVRPPCRDAVDGYPDDVGDRTLGSVILGASDGCQQASRVPMLVMNTNMHGIHSLPRWDCDRAAQTYLGPDADRMACGWGFWSRRRWDRSSSGWDGSQVVLAQPWMPERMAGSPVVLTYHLGDASPLARGCWDWSRRRVTYSICVRVPTCGFLCAQLFAHRGRGHGLQERMAFEAGPSGRSGGCSRSSTCYYIQELSRWLSVTSPTRGGLSRVGDHRLFRHPVRGRVRPPVQLYQPFEAGLLLERGYWDWSRLCVPAPTPLWIVAAGESQHVANNLRQYATDDVGPVFGHSGYRCAWDAAGFGASQMLPREASNLWRNRRGRGPIRRCIINKTLVGTFDIASPVGVF